MIMVKQCHSLSCSLTLRDLVIFLPTIQFNGEETLQLTMLETDMICQGDGMMVSYPIYYVPGVYACINKRRQWKLVNRDKPVLRGHSWDKEKVAL